jgi:hypothetical protein
MTSRSTTSRTKTPLRLAAPFIVRHRLRHDIETPCLWAAIREWQGLRQPSGFNRRLGRMILGFPCDLRPRNLSMLTVTALGLGTLTAFTVHPADIFMVSTPLLGVLNLKCL